VDRSAIFGGFLALFLAAGGEKNATAQQADRTEWLIPFSPGGEKKNN
jgi:hypothetical protein